MAGNLTAAVLSALIPGLGQIYKGHLLRGIFFMLTWWTVVLYFIGILDAYVLGSGEVNVTVVNEDKTYMQ
jgi:TM2 domain-containing membrane protein YozV